MVVKYFSDVMRADNAVVALGGHPEHSTFTLDIVLLCLDFDPHAMELAYIFDICV